MPMPTSRLLAFHCGGVRSFRGFYDVIDDNPTEVVYEPSMFFLVELDDTRVLFDTGMNPRQIRRDDGTIGIILDEGQLLPSQLATVGLTPADVDLVVVSHLHNDHSGGLEYLGDTPVYVTASELQCAQEPPVYQSFAYDPRDYDRDINWVVVDGERDLLGDERLTIIPAPGHTPGHQVLRVRLEHRTYVLCGDASYLEDKMRARRMPGVVWNPDLLVETWGLLEELERSESAELLFTHALDFEASRRLAPGEWYE